MLIEIIKDTHIAGNDYKKGANVGCSNADGAAAVKSGNAKEIEHGSTFDKNSKPKKDAK